MQHPTFGFSEALPTCASVRISISFRTLQAEDTTHIASYKRCSYSFSTKSERDFELKSF